MEDPPDEEEDFLPIYRDFRTTVLVPGRPYAAVQMRTAQQECKHLLQFAGAIVHAMAEGHEEERRVMHQETHDFLEGGAAVDVDRVLNAPHIDQLIRIYVQSLQAQRLRMSTIIHHVQTIQHALRCMFTFGLNLEESLTETATMLKQLEAYQAAEVAREAPRRVVQGSPFAETQPIPSIAWTDLQLIRYKVWQAWTLLPADTGEQRWLKARDAMALAALLLVTTGPYIPTISVLKRLRFGGISPTLLIPAQWPLPVEDPPLPDDVCVTIDVRDRRTEAGAAHETQIRVAAQKGGPKYVAPPRQWHLPPGHENWMVTFLFELVTIWRPLLLTELADTQEGYLLIDAALADEPLTRGDNIPCSNVTRLVRRSLGPFFRWDARGTNPWFVTQQHALCVNRQLRKASQFAAVLRAYQFFFVTKTHRDDYVRWFADWSTHCHATIAQIEASPQLRGVPAPADRQERTDLDQAHADIMRHVENMRDQSQRLYLTFVPEPDLEEEEEKEDIDGAFPRPAPGPDRPGTDFAEQYELKEGKESAEGPASMFDWRRNKGYTHLIERYSVQ